MGEGTLRMCSGGRGPLGRDSGDKCSGRESEERFWREVSGKLWRDILGERFGRHFLGKEPRETI